MANAQEKMAGELLKSLGVFRLGFFPTHQDFVDRLPPNFFEGLFACGVSEVDSGAMVQLLYALCIVKNSSDPLFILKPNLIQMLYETDLPEDMPVELLRLPFEGIKIDVPMGTFAPPVQNITRLYLTSVEGDRFRIVFADEEATHYASIITGGATSISDSIAKTKIHQEAVAPLSEEVRKFWVYQDYYKSDVFTFCVNAALYLTSEGADVIQDKSHEHSWHTALQHQKSKARRAMFESQLREAKKHKIYVCGGSLVVRPEFSASLTEEGRHLTKRFRVRGHYRNQPCGPNLSERKHMWIAPHWKGPTYAEMLERNYVIAQ